MSKTATILLHKCFSKLNLDNQLTWDVRTYQWIQLMKLQSFVFPVFAGETKTLQHTETQLLMETKLRNCHVLSFYLVNNKWNLVFFGSLTWHPASCTHELEKCLGNSETLDINWMKKVEEEPVEIFQFTSYWLLELREFWHTSNTVCLSSAHLYYKRCKFHFWLWDATFSSFWLSSSVMEWNCAVQWLQPLCESFPRKHLESEVLVVTTQ